MNMDLSDSSAILFSIKASVSSGVRGNVCKVYSISRRRVCLEHVVDALVLLSLCGGATVPTRSHIESPRLTLCGDPNFRFLAVYAESVSTISRFGLSILSPHKGQGSGVNGATGDECDNLTGIPWFELLESCRELGRKDECSILILRSAMEYFSQGEAQAASQYPAEFRHTARITQTDLQSFASSQKFGRFRRDSRVPFPSLSQTSFALSVS